MQTPAPSGVEPQVRRLSRGKTLAVFAAIGAAFIGAGYLLYLLSHALAWALGIPAWLAGAGYLVLVLELRVKGEPLPKGLLPARARRVLLWGGQALLLVWLWHTGHPALWPALALMVAARLWSWHWRSRRQARESAPVS